ncbi:hypothetical protein ACFXKF_36300 [Streptomyces scopuliridis]|uniref:hypothetical protein n=1 Tax=Streptomyces scopuliridis TaxID=452529 RepID=UPI00368193B9
MSQPTQPDPQNSRMADQPAPQPVHPAPPQEDRPSFDELIAQTGATDYSPLAAQLDDETRSALDLPPAPATLSVDRGLAQRIRTYLIEHPAKIASLPDGVRDLIHL